MCVTFSTEAGGGGEAESGPTLTPISSSILSRFFGRFQHCSLDAIGFSLATGIRCRDVLQYWMQLLQRIFKSYDYNYPIFSIISAAFLSIVGSANSPSSCSSYVPTFTSSLEVNPMLRSWQTQQYCASNLHIFTPRGGGMGREWALGGGRGCKPQGAMRQFFFAQLYDTAVVGRLTSSCTAIMPLYC